MTKSLSNGLEMLTAEEIHDITVRCHRGSELESITLGHRLLDDYVAFVAARARTNTWLAVASDLKIFFGVVAKEPTEVTRADVLGFLAAQRAPRRGARVVRLEDAEPGWRRRTIARRLSSVRGCTPTLRPGVTPA
jgi:integrase/recombinase XerD